MVSFLTWLAVAAAVVGGVVFALYLFWPGED
jgi:hypothetical protein